MTQFEITKVYDYTDKAKIIFERDIQFNGCSYLVIYGRHVNGGFIAIPNWNICTEAGDSDGILYNAEKLTLAGMEPSAALTLAEYISKVN